jgi:three-Cys-motif partner protein
MTKQPREQSIDAIGKWSEDKLRILRKYLAPYSRIMNRHRFKYAYIDAFAGSGLHVTKNEKRIVPGSPLEAMMVEPPFDEYYFIEMDKKKSAMLEKQVKDKGNVHIFSGDCNEILIKDVFPQVRYEDYRRAICFLDPYNIGLDWEVLLNAGKMRSIEIILNFSIMDINRNLKRKKPREEDIDRMNRFWGDETWRDYLFQTEPGLFGDIFERIPGNTPITRAFQERLKIKAGFKYVPEPIAMCNTKGAVVYFLFFASQNQAGNKIITDIFKSYQNRTQ